ncbi:MAG: thymidylate synthase [Candidatus Chisholmbacteria bacterium]|nr:thymidylate synthase [Candidatus Chisholmbacteria bacterium]
MTEIDRQYQKLLRQILETGVEEVNWRTGHKVKSLPGLTVVIGAEDGFPLVSLRKIPLRLFVAEQVWFLTGSRRPEEFLRKFTKIWDDFSSLSGVVTVAYGWRWRNHFGRDQIDELVRMLTKDSSNRQGVVVTWDPAGDGLIAKQKLNVPCPFAFTVNIIGGRLNFHNLVRSNDMMLGFPHDVAGFALLQRMLAGYLGVGVGRYTHSISHGHIYDIHYDAARVLVRRRSRQKLIRLEPEKDWLKRAMKGDEKLVVEVVDQIERQYRPLESIAGLKIVL